MKVFRRRIFDFTKETVDKYVDIFLYFTISSFADHFYQLRGCYAGAYENQCNNRSFIQEAIRGGMCYANPVWKKRECTLGLVNFNFNSMYPSAQKRIGETDGLGGIPKGPSRLMDIENMSYPYPYHYYVGRIKILRMAKLQQIPFVCKKVKGLVRRYNTGSYHPVL